MQIITLTSDFGARDYFVGAIKGAILKHVSGVQLVDISHQIEPYNMVQAAWVVKNSFTEFPSGSIHLLAVNCVYQSDAQFLVASCDGHYFFAPDNGLLSLIFDEKSIVETVKLPKIAAPHHFEVKSIFATALANFLPEKNLAALGEVSKNLLQRIQIQPVITKDRMRGTVLHIDNFGNAVLNIRREIFEQAASGRSFSLFFKRHDPITRLSNNYSDVEVGEPLCLFNSAGLLEISIYMGRAADLLGLKPEDVVELCFNE